MSKKKVKVFLTIFLITVLSFFFLKTFYEKKIVLKIDIEEDHNSSSSNILNEVSFSSKDEKGNIYSITAFEGEVDFTNSNIIFLKNLKAQVKLKNSNTISISSDFGKYNSENSDTIFSKNVLIDYLDNQIRGEYLEFSINRNLMTISRNVEYSNFENTLKADVIEMNIDTKNVKIFMYEDSKKVKIRGLN